MRIFIAIELDEPIIKSISALVDKLSKKNREAGIKWVRQEGIHLTLKFLGEIQEERLAAVKSVLEETSKSFDSFRLEVTGTGYFPTDKRNPRVLWVGVKAEETLIKLQDSLETRLEKIGFPREKRKFHPHLTLGRVKSVQFVQDVVRDLDMYREDAFGEMAVRKTTLFQSILKPSGAEYKIKGRFPLR